MIQQIIANNYTKTINNTSAIVTEGMYNVSIIEMLEYIKNGQIQEYIKSIKINKEIICLSYPKVNIVFFGALLFFSFMLIIINLKKMPSQINFLILVNFNLLVVKTEILTFIFFNKIFVSLNLIIIVYSMLVYFKHVTGYTTFIRNYREKHPVKIFSLNFPIKKVQQLIGEKIELIFRIKKGLQQQTLSVKSLLFIFGLTIFIILIYKLIKTLILQQLGIFILFGAFIHFIKESLEYPLVLQMQKVGKKIVEEGAKKIGLNVSYKLPEEAPKSLSKKEEQNIKTEIKKQENGVKKQKLAVNRSENNEEIHLPTNIFEKIKYHILTNSKKIDKETRLKLNSIVPKKLEHENPITGEKTQHSRKIFLKKTTDVVTGEIIDFNPKNTPHIDYLFSLSSPEEQFKYIINNIFRIRKEYRIFEMNKYEFKALNILEEEIEDIKKNSREKRLKFNELVLNKIMQLTAYQFYALEKQQKKFNSLEILRGEGTNQVSQFLNEVLMPYSIELQRNPCKNERIFLSEKTYYKKAEYDGFYFEIESEKGLDKIVKLHSIQAKCSQNMLQMGGHVKDFMTNPVFKNTTNFLGIIEDGFIFLEKDLETNKLIRAEFFKVDNAIRLLWNGFSDTLNSLIAGNSPEVGKQEVARNVIFKLKKKYSINSTGPQVFCFNVTEQVIEEIPKNKNNNVD